MNTAATNQDKARARLEQYQVAVKDLQYCAERIETLESQAMRSTTAIDAAGGWTGQYWGKTKDGQGWVIADDPALFKKPLRVLAVPKGKRKTPDPKAGEKLMVGLIDLILEYEEKALDALQLCRDIEREIAAYCSGEHVNVLRYRYIEGLTYGAMGKRLRYSERHLRRLIDEALDEFGSNL